MQNAELGHWLFVLLTSNSSALRRSQSDSPILRSRPQVGSEWMHFAN